MLRKNGKPKLTPLQRKSLGINSGVNASNRAQLKKIKKVDTNKNLPQVPISDLYMRVDNVWKYKGKTCRLCNLMMTDQTVIDKHRYICEVLNKEVEETNMPIHRIQRGNQTYYRYGTTGKEYRTLAEAERQAAAIKASQAREAEKKKK